MPDSIGICADKYVIVFIESSTKLHRRQDNSLSEPVSRMKLTGYGATGEQPTMPAMEGDSILGSTRRKPPGPAGGRQVILAAMTLSLTLQPDSRRSCPDWCGVDPHGGAQRDRGRGGGGVGGHTRRGPLRAARQPARLPKWDEDANAERTNRGDGALAAAGHRGDERRPEGA